MKKAKVLDIIVESINYVIISYALTNMTFLFSASPLYVVPLLCSSYCHDLFYRADIGNVYSV